jgi:hypothetical protein
MRLYTRTHRHYCGIDLHARTMFVCVLNQEGEVLLHRNLHATPKPFSLHTHDDRLHGTRADLCPSPEPGQNWRSARRGHACTSLLSGTVRGNERVSRTWERRMLSHPPRAEALDGFGADAAEPR